MSSTRHAAAGSPLRQERYASSPEFERGLIATAVARRCAVLDGATDRELIWWLHFMSHQPGGLKALALGLIAKYADRVGTAQMLRIGKGAGTYSADQVREIRKGLPCDARQRFPLRAEVDRHRAAGARARQLLRISQDWDGESLSTAQDDPEFQAIESEAEKHPDSYPVEVFVALCKSAALDGQGDDCRGRTECLEDYLRNLAIDPAIDLAAASPWYFAELIPTLRAYLAAWLAQRAGGAVVTAIGRKVCETLDYTLHSQTMTLVEGEARIGKSFSARTWCEQHPGRARFIEVPTGNDDTGFFRAIARGLGLGNFQQYKAVEIRERVESVLLAGDLLLCFDEAHRLWPETNFRYGFPKRINWVMSMANQGVAICLVATPQFIARQKAAEQNSWNSAQFIGRLGHYEPLPRELELDDLTAVARFVLPEADKPTVRALAAYARTSARYLSAIDTIAKRARYIAQRDGRDQSTTADVRTAMNESVIPSDSKIARALQPLRNKMASVRRGVDSNEMPAPLPALEPTRRPIIPDETTGQIIPRNRLNSEPAELVANE